jgi:hypothetical protein
VNIGNRFELNFVHKYQLHFDLFIDSSRVPSEYKFGVTYRMGLEDHMNLVRVDCDQFKDTILKFIQTEENTRQDSRERRRHRNVELSEHIIQTWSG